MRSETGKNLRAHSASPILRTYAISAAFMATLFAPACAQSPTPFVDLTPTAPEAGAYKIVAGSKDVISRGVRYYQIDLAADVKIEEAGAMVISTGITV
mgnify:CR=1 FL=1